MPWREGGRFMVSNGKREEHGKGAEEMEEGKNWWKRWRRVITEEDVLTLQRYMKSSLTRVKMELSRLE